MIITHYRAVREALITVTDSGFKTVEEIVAATPEPEAEVRAVLNDLADDGADIIVRTVGGMTSYMVTA